MKGWQEAIQSVAAFGTLFMGFHYLHSEPGAIAGVYSLFAMIGVAAALKWIFKEMLKS